MVNPAEHICNNCGDFPVKDECYCKNCYESAQEDSYAEGKKEGEKNNQ